MYKPEVQQRTAYLPAAALLLLLWVCLVLPAALISQYFPLDLSTDLKMGLQFPSNLWWILSPHNGSGRYFPLYWLYHVALFRVLGTALPGYYVIQGIIFLGTILIASRMFSRLVNNSRYLIALCFALFLSTPNVETLYTLGKSEGQVCFFSFLVLGLFYRFGLLERKTTPWIYSAMFASFLCALWWKETSIALFPFALTGLVTSFVLAKQKPRTRDAGASAAQYGRLLIVLVAAYGCSKIPYFLFDRSTAARGTSYTNFVLTAEIITDNVWFYLTQQPDVFFVGAFATLLVVLQLFRLKKELVEADRPKERDDLVFVFSLLAMAWSYYGAFLIWRWPMGYYHFLPALLFRVAAMYGIYHAVRSGIFTRRAWISLSCVAGVLALYCGAYLWYCSSSQVVYSRVYTKMLEAYIRNSVPGDSLILESFPFYAEQTNSSETTLDVVLHQRRTVRGVADLVDPAVVTPAMRQLLRISDESLEANWQNLPKRGDLLATMTGNKLGTWQVRGAVPLYSDGSFWQKDGAYVMQLLDSDATFSPTLFINTWTHLPQLSSTYIGYKIYRVLEGPRFMWRGRFPDGWMGHEARLTLSPQYSPSATLFVSTPKYNAGNLFTIRRGTEVIERRVLEPGKEYSFRLHSQDGQARAVFDFYAEKAFVPKKLWLNDDRRELGALLRLEIP